MFDALEDLQGSVISDLIQPNQSTSTIFKETFDIFRDKPFNSNDSVTLTVSELTSLFTEHERILRQLPENTLPPPHLWHLYHEYWIWFLFCITVYTTIGNYLTYVIIIYCRIISLYIS